MNKLKMQSKNLVDENIDFIAGKFPNCVSEGLDESGKLIKVVDFDLLKQELSNVVVEGNEERYVLNWAGKKASMLAANAPIAKTLRPVFEESVGKNGDSGKFDSENLYIEGDNLDVLKLLRETYLGKVKMIYIDPPYNTGRDFVYEDDFSMTSEEYFEKSKQIDDQGNRLFTNNDSNGRFHSDWLSMMYSRLKLAKDLLTDDGVIFISIDDSEQANLKKLCDEVFGERNFVANLVWANKEGGGGSDSKLYKVKHEYVLSYGKNIDKVIINKVIQKEDSSYSFEDEYLAERGKYKLIKLNSFSIQYSASLDYPINYNEEKIYPSEDGKQGCWRWSKTKFEWGMKNDFIVFKKGIDGKTKVYTKQYFKVDNNGKQIVRGLPPVGLIERYSSTMASKELERIIGNHMFDYSKPADLIKSLLKNMDSKKEGIILDFFSGSATTAHAVMQLNAEDGGNRKHIMVQLPEITDAKSTAYKHGYKNICEIGKERIRRAGKKILEDNKNSKEPKDLSNLDIGFRVLKLDDSNMKDVYYSPSELKQETIFDIAENIKEDRTEEDLLFQVMLDMGVLLSSEIKTLDFDGKKVFNVNDGNLVCCFDKNLSESVVTQIAQMKPLYAVFRDSSITSDSMSVNFDQIFETYSPTTTRKVI